MKVLIQKPDLDTCLTALILGVSEGDNIIVSKSDASQADILNPDILCIEAGGSGLVHLNNFDHHDPERYYPPACRQAYDYQPSAISHQPSEHLSKLVEYVCIVDDRVQEHPKVEFPSLSNIFSGMLLVERNTVSQFLKGIEILNKVMKYDLNPFDTMPDIDEWNPYMKAKEENIKGVEEVLRRAEFYTAKNGFKVGFVESDFIGGIGALYAHGCDVVIMYYPSFGEPPASKYTVAGNNKKVSHLLEYFDKIENGWGGREMIIGSPREGTRLGKDKVIELIVNSL